MNGWYTLLIVLAALMLLLAVPVGVVIRWEESLTLKLKIGFLKLQLLPRKKPASEKKTARKGKSPAAPTKRAGSKPTRQQILYSIDPIAALVADLLSRFRRGLRFDPLRIHVEVAGEDPADTAVLYGKLYAAVAALMPALTEAVTVRRQDIQITLNFDRTQWMVSADVGISMRLWHLIGILFRLMFGGVSWYLGYRKLAPQEQTPTDGTNAKTPVDSTAPAA